MKRKWNILVNIGLVCLCLCAIAVGVYSAKTANLSVGGTIGFTANDCKVTILASMSGGSSSSTSYEAKTITDAELVIDGTTKTSASWDIGTVYFDDYYNTTPYKLVADIVFTFKVTNNSNFYIDANINQDFLGNESVYVYAPNLGETIAPNGEYTFTVKLQLQRDKDTDHYPDSLALNVTDASALMTFNKCDAPAYLANGTTSNWKTAIAETFGISDITTTTKISFVRALTSGLLTDFDKDDDNNFKTANVGATELDGVVSDKATPITAYCKTDSTTGTQELVIYSASRIYAPTNCNFLFQKWVNLTACILDNFDTSNTTKMSSVFSGYWSNGVKYIALETVDISKLDTTKVTMMHEMFYGCNKLTTLNLKNFSTENLTRTDNMFFRCSKLESIDVSNFNTEKVTNMNQMFVLCEALKTLDLTSFDISKVTNCVSMFANCKVLTTIYVGKTWNLESLGTDGDKEMFHYAYRLVGGNGTAYDEQKVTATYACIDGEYGLEGYFTRRVF